MTIIVFTVQCVGCGKRRTALRASDGKGELLRLPTGWWQTVVLSPADFASVVCDECMRVDDQVESQRIAIDAKLDPVSAPEAN
jgi:hypothetical protein